MLTGGFIGHWQPNLNMETQGKAIKRTTNHVDHDLERNGDRAEVSQQRYKALRAAELLTDGDIFGYHASVHEGTSPLTGKDCCKQTGRPLADSTTGIDSVKKDDAKIISKYMHFRGNEETEAPHVQTPTEIDEYSQVMHQE